MVTNKRENPCNHRVADFSMLHSITGGTIHGRMDGHFLSCQCPTQSAAFLHMRMGKSSKLRCNTNKYQLQFETLCLSMIFLNQDSRNM